MFASCKDGIVSELQVIFKLTSIFFVFLCWLLFNLSTFLEHCHK